MNGFFEILDRLLICFSFFCMGYCLSTLVTISQEQKWREKRWQEEEQRLKELFRETKV
jgi:hypothetical protein